MGWCPRDERSTTASLRCASAMPASASTNTPASSGPRCISLSAIASARACSASCGSPDWIQNPPMPHIAGGSAEPARGDGSTCPVRSHRLSRLVAAQGSTHAAICRLLSVYRQDPWRSRFHYACGPGYPKQHAHANRAEFGCPRGYEHKPECCHVFVQRLRGPTSHVLPYVKSTLAIRATRVELLQIFIVRRGNDQVTAGFEQSSYLGNHCVEQRSREVLHDFK